MLAFERHSYIKERILTEGRVQVSQLSALFNVTEETIRRDLEKLEEAKILNRIYGGAVAIHSPLMIDQPFIARREINRDAKATIASLVRPFLDTGMTLFADSSSTVLASLELSKSIPLTVISNSINLFSTLGKSSLTLISTGGYFNSPSLSLYGAIAQEMVLNYHVDIALVSCKALSITESITESNQNEVALKRLMIQRAKKVFLLADSSKFDRVAFSKLFDFSDIDYLVTEKVPSTPWQKFILKTSLTILNEQQS